MIHTFRTTHYAACNLLFSIRNVIFTIPSQFVCFEKLQAPNFLKTAAHFVAHCRAVSCSPRSINCLNVPKLRRSKVRDCVKRLIQNTRVVTPHLWWISLLQRSKSTASLIENVVKERNVVCVSRKSTSLAARCRSFELSPSSKIEWFYLMFWKYIQWIC